VRQPSRTMLTAAGADCKGVSVAKKINKSGGEAPPQSRPDCAGTPLRRA
jgi:hypothetical protein